jgi:hypothetical protein
MTQRRGSSRRDFLLGVGALGLSSPLMTATPSPLVPEAGPVACTIYPAEPPQLASLEGATATALSKEDGIVLANGYLEVQLSPDSGVMTSLTNKLTGQIFEIQGDQVGFSLLEDKGDQPPDRDQRQSQKTSAWYARAADKKVFDVSLQSDESGAVAELRFRPDGLTISLLYRLGANDFWIERRLKVEAVSGELHFDSLDYGRAVVPQADRRQLELGKFDRPAFLTVGNGGVFTGVGWWFYGVSPEGI